MPVGRFPIVISLFKGPSWSFLSPPLSVWTQLCSRLFSQSWAPCLQSFRVLMKRLPDSLWVNSLRRRYETVFPLSVIAAILEKLRWVVLLPQAQWEGKVAVGQGFLKVDHGFSGLYQQFSWCHSCVRLLPEWLKKDFWEDFPSLPYKTQLDWGEISQGSQRSCGVYLPLWYCWAHSKS